MTSSSNRKRGQGVGEHTLRGRDGEDGARFTRTSDADRLLAIKDTLIAGGLGRIEHLVTGIPSGGPPPTPASIDLANPEGQEFNVGLAELLALFALLARAM